MNQPTPFKRSVVAFQAFRHRHAVARPDNVEAIHSTIGNFIMHVRIETPIADFGYSKRWRTASSTRLV
jgi:hypothetical protein